MAIVIRDADLKHDRQVMMECLLRNRVRYEDNHSFQTRFDWAYRHNPHGEGRAWLAIDDASGRVVGFTSAFPRRVVVEGREMIGWNCADFSIDREYRTLGAAMKLRRAAKECVDRGEFQFLFAHPNDRMRVVHEKVGHLPIGKMVRYAALLRLDHKLRIVLHSRTAAGLLARMADPFLRLVTRGTAAIRDYRFALAEESHYGEEYDRLFDRVRQHYRIIVHRDSEYLAWRFLQNPLYRTRSFRMMRGDELAGYVLFYEANQVAHVGDVLVSGDTAEMQALLGALIHHLRRAQFVSVSLRLHHANPLLAVARELGFRQREDATSTVIAYAAASAPHAALILDGKSWYMTVGDRDI